jgi:hypothetical protein
MKLVCVTRRTALNFAVWVVVAIALVYDRNVSSLELVGIVASLPLVCKISWSLYDWAREEFRSNRYDHNTALAYLDKASERERAKWEAEY